MLQLTSATAPEDGWPAVASIVVAPNALAGASSNSPPTKATTARTDHARIAPHPENTLNKLRIADRPPGDHNDPLAGLPPQPIPTLPPDATTYRPTRRTSRRVRGSKSTPLAAPVRADTLLSERRTGESGLRLATCWTEVTHLLGWRCGTTE